MPTPHIAAGPDDFAPAVLMPGDPKRAERIAQLAGTHDIVGLQEADPGSWRSGFTNQTHYLAERAGFEYWSHQPNRRVGAVASSANGLLSRLEPIEVINHALPGRIGGRGVLISRFGEGDADEQVRRLARSSGRVPQRAFEEFAGNVTDAEASAREANGRETSAEVFAHESEFAFHVVSP